MENNELENLRKENYKLKEELESALANQTTSLPEFFSQKYLQAFQEARRKRFFDIEQVNNLYDNELSALDAKLSSIDTDIESDEGYLAAIEELDSSYKNTLEKEEIARRNIAILEERLANKQFILYSLTMADFDLIYNEVTNNPDFSLLLLNIDYVLPKITAKNHGEALECQRLQFEISALKKEFSALSKELLSFRENLLSSKHQAALKTKALMEERINAEIENIKEQKRANIAYKRDLGQTFEAVKQKELEQFVTSIKEKMLSGIPSSQIVDEANEFIEEAYQNFLHLESAKRVLEAKKKEYELLLKEKKSYDKELSRYELLKAMSSEYLLYIEDARSILDGLTKYCYEVDLICEQSYFYQDIAKKYLHLQQDLDEKEVLADKAATDYMHHMNERQSQVLSITPEEELNNINSISSLLLANKLQAEEALKKARIDLERFKSDASTAEFIRMLDKRNLINASFNKLADKLERLIKRHELIQTQLASLEEYAKRVEIINAQLEQLAHEINN